MKRLNAIKLIFAELSINSIPIKIATALRLEKSGTCAEARIVLGSVASSPLRAFDAEKKLMGGKLTPNRIDDAVKIASKLAMPVDNTDMNLGFRKKIVKYFLKRAIDETINYK